MTSAPREPTSTRAASGADTAGPSGIVATTGGGSGSEALASSQGRTT